MRNPETTRKRAAQADPQERASGRPTDQTRIRVFNPSKAAGLLELDQQDRTEQRHPEDEGEISTAEQPDKSRSLRNCSGNSNNQRSRAPGASFEVTPRETAIPPPARTLPITPSSVPPHASAIWARPSHASNLSTARNEHPFAGRRS